MKKVVLQRLDVTKPALLAIAYISVLQNLNQIRQLDLQLNFSCVNTRHAKKNVKTNHLVFNSNFLIHL
jgi:hypothetical protein